MYILLEDRGILCLKQLRNHSFQSYERCSMLQSLQAINMQKMQLFPAKSSYKITTFNIAANIFVYFLLSEGFIPMDFEYFRMNASTN